MAFVYIFLIIFGVSAFPIFMPPTWTVLSFIAIQYHPVPWELALLGATAAMMGRLVLAKLSRIIIRQNFMGERTRQNIDTIKIHLERRPGLTFGVLLFYAFTPLPTNQLFIAYGLTDMRLRLIAIPFFIGRLITYFAYASMAHFAAVRLFPHGAGKFFGMYFVATQVLTVLVVYLFAKIHWHELLTKKKLVLTK
jgi:hypothetical protein